MGSNSSKAIITKKMNSTIKFSQIKLQKQKLRRYVSRKFSSIAAKRKVYHRRGTKTAQDMTMNKIPRKSFEQSSSYEKNDESQLLVSNIDIIGEEITNITNLTLESKQKKQGYKVYSCSCNGLVSGKPKVNQDAYVTVENFNDSDDLFIGVFDGHGINGELVSNYVSQNIPLILSNFLTMYPINQSLLYSFKSIHDNISDSLINTDLSGTTGTVALIQDDVMSIAWVGDSKAVMGETFASNRLIARDITVDHKPWLPNELKRIHRHGGVVTRAKDLNGNSYGPFRVYNQHQWYPGLAMSRAIGDKCANKLGVSEVPDINTIKLDNNIKFVIFASDGVWEFISSQEAVDIVSQSPTPQFACNQLLEIAKRRWIIEEHGSCDDITVSILDISS